MGKATKKKKPDKTSEKTNKGRAKPKRTTKPAITAEKYNEMWFAYKRLQNVHAVAVEVQVTYRTAQRYIIGPGAPDYGMVPIRDRFNRVQARAQQEQELDLLSFRRREQKKALALLQAVQGEMQLAFGDVRARLKKYQDSKGKEDPEREMGLKDLAQTYDKAVRLVEHLLGGPDITVAGGGSGAYDPLNSLTDEEAQEYVTTGRLPKDIEVALAQLEQENT